jgi:hypothetical protein
MQAKTGARQRKLSSGMLKIERIKNDPMGFEENKVRKKITLYRGR